MPGPVLYGIDVSVYQGDLDWSRVAGEGFAFATARSGVGAYYSDPTFARNLAGAEAAGLVAGGYHVLTRDPVAAQADRFLAQLGEAEGRLVVVDVETYGRRDETGRPVRDGLTGNLVREDPRYGDLVAFLALLRERIGAHPVLLYTGRWFWTGHAWPTRDPDGAGLGVHLWDSRYVPDPARPGKALSDLASVVHARIPDPMAWRRRGYGGWAEASVMQFTDAAKVAGKRLDADAFYGTRAELEALTRTPVHPLVAARAAYLHTRVGDLPGAAPGPAGWHEVAAGIPEEVAA